MKKSRKPVMVIASGYFNPPHLGHAKLFLEASRLGDCLIVIVNNDKQVKLKGSVPFMKEKERRDLVSHFKGVTSGWLSKDKDKTVCETLKEIVGIHDGYDFIFANGGDRKNTNDIPEYKLCKSLGVKMVFGVGGKKIQSSSWLIKKASKKVK